MQDLAAPAAVDDLSTAQVSLVVVGVALAIAAAVVTNVVAAQRGHVKRRLDEEIEELETRIQRAHSALTRSLETNRSARLLWAIVELRPAPPDAFYESYFHTTVGWLAQAGMDAAGGLDVDLSSGRQPEETPELRPLLLARAAASRSGPGALQTLVDEGDALRGRLVPHIRTLVDRHSREVLERGDYERTTLRLLSFGTSVQILSLVAITAKDLV